MELIRRAIAKGYSALGIADHVGASTLERVIVEAARDCQLARKHWDFRAYPGVELTHVPPGSVAELARRAREVGATHVVVHGESPVEPVCPGTNEAAANCDEVDILAHPGLLTFEEAQAAAAHDVFIEVTARKGHSLGNGRVAQLVLTAGAKFVLDSDTHGPDDLLTLEFARTVALGAGLEGEQIESLLTTHPEELLQVMEERYQQQWG